jgi:hypothetical protein
MTVTRGSVVARTRDGRGVARNGELAAVLRQTPPRAARIHVQEAQP